MTRTQRAVSRFSVHAMHCVFGGSHDKHLAHEGSSCMRQHLRVNGFALEHLETPNQPPMREELNFSLRRRIARWGRQKASLSGSPRRTWRMAACPRAHCWRRCTKSTNRHQLVLPNFRILSRGRDGLCGWLVGSSVGRSVGLSVGRLFSWLLGRLAGGPHTQHHRPHMNLAAAWESCWGLV